MRFNFVAAFGFQAAAISSSKQAAASRMARKIRMSLSLVGGGSGGGVLGMMKVLLQWLHWWWSPWIGRWLVLWHWGQWMGLGMVINGAMTVADFQAALDGQGARVKRLAVSGCQAMFRRQPEKWR